MLKNWKLKLRYGKLKTPFKHFTVIADGIVGTLKEGFICRPGNAYMGMKTWSTSAEESGDLIIAIGENIGFKVTGKIQIFETDPTEPPGKIPRGYDINFTPYDK